MTTPKKKHIHHIDLNPSNNTPSNLIEVDYGCHWDLHEEIYYLFEKWDFGNRKSDHYRDLIKYLLNSGELVFDREVPGYRFVLIEGGALDEYYKSVKQTGQHLPLCGILSNRIKNIKIQRNAWTKFLDRMYGGSS